MSEERIAALEAQVAALSDHLEFAKGRALGLEAAALVFARHWGMEPQSVIEALHNAMEILDDPQRSPNLVGTQKRSALELVELVSSALHSRNR